MGGGGGSGGGERLVLACGNNDAGQLGRGHRDPHVSNRSPQVSLHRFKRALIEP
jgi:hypothetical protein